MDVHPVSTDGSCMHWQACRTTSSRVDCMTHVLPMRPCAADLLVLSRCVRYACASCGAGSGPHPAYTTSPVAHHQARQAPVQPQAMDMQHDPGMSGVSVEQESPRQGPPPSIRSGVFCIGMWQVQQYGKLLLCSSGLVCSCPDTCFSKTVCWPPPVAVHAHQLQVCRGARSAATRWKWYVLVAAGPAVCHQGECTPCAYMLTSSGVTPCSNTGTQSHE